MAMAAEAVGRCLLTVLPIWGCRCRPGDAQWRQQDGTASGPYHRRRRRHLHLPVLLRTGQSRAGAKSSGLAVERHRTGIGQQADVANQPVRAGQRRRGRRHRPAKPIAVAAGNSGRNRFRGIVPGDRDLPAASPCQALARRVGRAGAIDRKRHQRCFSDTAACHDRCFPELLERSALPGRCGLSSGAWRFAGRLSQFLDLCRQAVAGGGGGCRDAVPGSRSCPRVAEHGDGVRAGTGRRGPAAAGAVTEGLSTRRAGSVAS